MSAAHRAVGNRTIRSTDLPHLFALAIHLALPTLALWIAGMMLNIPLGKGALFLGVCYVAFLGGRRVKRLLLELFTPTSAESRQDAEQTIRDTTTVTMEWKRAPVSAPAEGSVSDRGVNERDALSEHPHPRYAALRRPDVGAQRAPARV